MAVTVDDDKRNLRAILDLDFLKTASSLPNKVVKSVNDFLCLRGDIKERLDQLIHDIRVCFKEIMETEKKNGQVISSIQ
jgi:hypothetical protein